MAIVTHWYDWNWVAAEKEFKRAIELNPNNSDAHTYYSWFLAPMERYDQAIAESKLAQRADPQSGLRLQCGSGFRVCTTVGSGH